MKAIDLTCFAGPAAGRSMRGNRAQVYMNTPAPAAVPKAAATRVFVTGRDAEWRADSFDAVGSPIRFCGHGALAAARVTVARMGADRLPLRFHNAYMHWRVLSCEPAAESGSAQVVLSFPRPEVAMCDVPEFVGSCFDVEIKAAARAGPEDGYLIVETESAARVAAARVDPDAVARATRRAMILTAGAGDEFVFRYFAPQYGVAEDSATGSAAVQLAAYWNQRNGMSEFAVAQLSPAGGSMRLACDTGAVELCGAVAYGWHA